MDATIDRMAADLGVFRYSNETQYDYQNRVLYSAMASWIKAIVMDQPPGSKEEGFVGVSRRHVYERSRTILETFCKMYPGSAEWFDLQESEEHPVSLIRTRLISHGDLLNEGFDTNIALSVPYAEQLTAEAEVVYGKIMGEDLRYCGISTIRNHKAPEPEHESEEIVKWIDNFVREAWWASSLPDNSILQYFNPFLHARNNYLAWGDLEPETVQGIVLARTIVNKSSHEYYLIRERDKLVHKIDPFLQKMGYHCRVMYGLRKAAGNAVTASFSRYDEHVLLSLNAYLPLRETGLLESFAWPHRHINDRLKWSVDLSVWCYIKFFIEALGIQILEDSHG